MSLYTIVVVKMKWGGGIGLLTQCGIISESQMNFVAASFLFISRHCVCVCAVRALILWWKIIEHPTKVHAIVSKHIRTHISSIRLIWSGVTSNPICTQFQSHGNCSLSIDKLNKKKKPTVVGFISSECSFIATKIVGEKMVGRSNGNGRACERARTHIHSPRWNAVKMERVRQDSYKVLNWS